MTAIICMIAAVQALGASPTEFHRLGPEEQLYSPAAMAVFAELPPYSRTPLWPSGEGVTLFRSAEIPNEVRAEAKDWIERIIVPHRRPATLESWFVGVRGPLHKDVVSVRYRNGDDRVQIQESEVVVEVTVEMPAGPVVDDAESCRVLVRQVLLDWVAVPEGQHQHAIIDARPFNPATSPQLYGGFININAQGLNSGNMKWWNRISFAACESTVSLLISKADGTQGYGTAKTSQPGAQYIPRFGSGKGG
jgi:hypothetical protein